MYLRLLLLASAYRNAADYHTGSRREWRLRRADELLALALTH